MDDVGRPDDQRYVLSVVVCLEGPTLHTSAEHTNVLEEEETTKEILEISLLCLSVPELSSRLVGPE